MFRSALLRLATLGVVLCTGCAAATTDAALADMKLRLSDAQRKDADSRRRIDDLENRVFLLTDQLESSKVAAQTTRSPRLPVVTLRPVGDEPAPHAVASTSIGASSSSGASEEGGSEEPEFTGAAQSTEPARVRTVLSGSGFGDGTSTTIASTPTTSPEPKHKAHAKVDSDVRFASTSGSDNLGVAPAPPIAKAHVLTADRMDRTDRSERAERAPLDEEPLTAYRAAYADVSAGHYDDAAVKLRAFVKRFPHHDYADNAQYWLGECFYARQRYQEAAAEFRTAVAKYPTGNKAPDALLKLAYSLLASDQAAEGKRLLEELPSTYPRSEAARLASQRLAELTKTASNRSEAGR